MTNIRDFNGVTAGPSGVDGAVGVGSPGWYVAIVNARHEKTASAVLEHMGYETMVAAQPELRVWRNGRRKTVDRIVIPSVVFVRCTERQRREIVALPCILRFMVNRAAYSGSLNKPAAVIPAAQIARLRFMLGQSDYPVTFEAATFRANDNVRVLRGPLQGLTGTVAAISAAAAATATEGAACEPTQTVTVILDHLGCARLTLPARDLELL